MAGCRCFRALESCTRIIRRVRRRTTWRFLVYVASYYCREGVFEEPDIVVFTDIGTWELIYCTKQESNTRAGKVNQKWRPVVGQKRLLVHVSEHPVFREVDKDVVCAYISKRYDLRALGEPVRNSLDVDKSPLGFGEGAENVDRIRLE